MSDSQAKRTLPRMLISLLITLVIGAVWFYVSLPAINLHNTGFYSFVFILLLVYILVFMIILGVDTGHQEIHLKDYLYFAKNQCKIVVLIVVVMAAIFVVGQLISAPIFRAGSYHELLDVGTGDFATEIEPVSSETMTTMASEFSLIPIPARWRMPKSRLRFTFLLSGSMQPAANTRPRRTITAPSCIGALTKKIFFKSSADTAASSTVPLRTMSSSKISRSKTIRAPVRL